MGPTVTLYETSDGCVFGGFTSVSWKSSGHFTSCPDAFLFSLVFLGKDSPGKCAHKHSEYAIYSHSDRHPCFGEGHDICAYALTTTTGNGSSMHTNPQSYAAPISNWLAGPTGTWWYTDITVVSWPR